MKIFIVIPEMYAGCGFYRQYQPHNRLCKTDDVDIVLSSGTHNENGLAVKADIVLFHKGHFSPSAAEDCKKHG